MTDGTSLRGVWRQAHAVRNWSHVTPAHWANVGACTSAKPLPTLWCVACMLSMTFCRAPRACRRASIGCRPGCFRRGHFHMLAVQQMAASTPFAAPDAIAGGAWLSDHVDRVRRALPRLRPLPAVRVQVPARSCRVTICNGAFHVLPPDRHASAQSRCASSGPTNVDFVWALRAHNDQVYTPAAKAAAAAAAG